MIALASLPADRAQRATQLVQILAARRARSAAGVAERADLEQIGYAIVLEMAPRYDPSLGDFDAYVSTRVRGAMIDYIDKLRRMQRRERDPMAALFPAVPLDRLPLEEMMRLSDEDNRRRAVQSLAIEVAGVAMSTLFTGDDAEDAMLDRLHIERAKQALFAFMEKLPERDRTVLLEVWKGEKSQEAIAASLGLAYRTLKRIVADTRLALLKELMAAGLVEKH